MSSPGLTKTIGPAETTSTAECGENPQQNEDQPDPFEHGLSSLVYLFALQIPLDKCKARHVTKHPAVIEPRHPQYM